MAELVPDDEPGLLGVHQVEKPGGDHEERAVGAQSHGVDRGVLRDEQLGHRGQVKDVAAVQHRLVQLEADFLDMPRLLVAEQIAGAANIEIVAGELEAGAQ